MIKGIYHSAAGMIANQRQLEIVSNNLANADTAGYKQERVAFRNVLDASPRPEAPVTEGEKFVTSERGLYGVHHQGTFEETQNPLDVAIMGDGFFVVETPHGLAYTRDGRFQLNLDGELTTLTGYRVMTEGGAVQIPEGNLRITTEGELLLQGEDPRLDKVIDRLMLVSFNDPFSLRPTRDGLLVTGQVPHEMEYPRLEPGYVEASNVDVVSAMVEMIQINKLFEASSNAIRTQDASLGKAVNEIARLK
jgi:flagellar basal-body rod protein FlgG